MRSLRYRIVTLTSVLLALAAGIILGNGALQGDDTVATASGSESGDDLAAAQARIADQAKNLAFADAYATATGQDLVAKKLAGRAVTVVTLPGADDETVDRLSDTVAAAGGTVAARVALDDTMLDVSQRQLVSELARQMDVGATEKAVGVPAESGEYGRMSRLLAYALLTGDPGGDQPDRVAQGIMAGFTTAGLVTPEGELTRRGNLALVVGGAPYGSADERDGAGSILAELLPAFDRVGDGTVLAAPVRASAPDGLVTAVRRHPRVAEEVSTVDVADQAAGAVITVLALASDLVGNPGDYGSEAAADGPLPTPKTTDAQASSKKDSDESSKKDNKKNGKNDKKND